MRFAPAAVDVCYRADGSAVARSPAPLPEPPRSLALLLEQWAASAPARPFVAERADRAQPGAGGWRVVSYAEALALVERLGQALLDRGLGPERPLVILSDNGVDHALLALAAMQAGIPVAPLSPAYALQSRDFAKLRAIAALLTPGLVFAEDGAPFAAAFAAVFVASGLPADAFVCARNPPPGATPLAALSSTRAGAALAAARAAVGPDSVAKVLFTSGSTGQPKGVINTQRMLTANQEMLAAGWPFLRAQPPVVVDWLPWSHTFGGNHNFNLVLRHGGTLYVDDGKPTPARIGRTIEALRDVAPTLYFNVPRGFDVLLPHLERDAALAAHFLSRLELLFYAAAALPEPLWHRLTALVRAHGRDVPLVSAWGATETSPLATQVHYTLDGAGNIGLPPPGVALKLAPVGGKLELRVRGPHVTPGYWRAPALTAAAFDDEGYYRTGDAARWLDAADPRRGLVFDGRLAEDFKLTSGSWVRVGALRLGVLAAAAPLVQDAVVAGHDRDYVALLLFVDGEACARAGDWRAVLRDKLRDYNRAVAQPSLCVRRALVAVEPPSIDADEITDKGYLNQRAILARRSALVARLYADGSDDAELLICE